MCSEFGDLLEEQQSTVDLLLAAFRLPQVASNKEVQLKIQHLKMFLEALQVFHPAQQDRVEAEAEMHCKRKRFVDKVFQEYDLHLHNIQEWENWSWSPLFRAMRNGYLPSTLPQPFLHNNR